jgi:hypothetical protein
MKEYIPLISVLIGGVIGFLASFITNWQSNKFKSDGENKAFQRKKREELYYTIAKLSSEYDSYMGSCLLKVINQQPFKIEEKGEIHTWSELSMIVNLYFPEFKEDVSTLLKERDSVGEVLAETISFKSTSQKDMKDLNGKIMVSFGRIKKRFEKFQEKISTLST